MKQGSKLYSSSLLLVITSISGATVGFLFWMIAARIYPTESIGIASVLISSVTLPVIFSRLGLDQALVRYFPEGNKSRIFSTTLLITTLFALFFGVAFVLIMNSISEEMHFLRDYLVYYFIFLIPSSMGMITGLSLVAMRRTGYYFAQSLFGYSRILILYPLAIIGTLGIFASIGISSILALLFSLFLLYRLGVRIVGIDFRFLRESLGFVLPNYIFYLLIVIPIQWFPIMVLGILGPKETAIYSISYSIFSMLQFIPSGLMTSLFVEGSHGEATRKMIHQVTLYMFLMITPIILLFNIFPEFILGLFGVDFVSGANLLRILSISSIPYGLCFIFFTMRQIQKKVNILIVLGAAVFSIQVMMSYILLPIMGIVAIGYGWLAGYGVCSIVILIYLLRHEYGRRSSARSTLK